MYSSWVALQQSIIYNGDKHTFDCVEGTELPDGFRLPCVPVPDNFLGIKGSFIIESRYKPPKEGMIIGQGENGNGKPYYITVLEVQQAQTPTSSSSKTYKAKEHEKHSNDNKNKKGKTGKKDKNDKNDKTIHNDNDNNIINSHNIDNNNVRKPMNMGF